MRRNGISNQDGAEVQNNSLAWFSLNVPLKLHWASLTQSYSASPIRPVGVPVALMNRSLWPMFRHGKRRTEKIGPLNA
jgi:hypothetical protein